MQLRAYSAPWRDCIEFLARGRNDDNNPVVGFTIGWKEAPIPGVSAEPTFSLTVGEAQCLIDDLWNCGLRPTEGTGSAGSLKATERHLEDMRRLVFGEKK